MDWRLKGKCAKLTPPQYDKLFFPNSGRSINNAKKFCTNCPVEEECLEFALTNEVKGIWAGTSEKDRIGILRFRNQLSGIVVAKKIVARKNITFN